MANDLTGDFDVVAQFAIPAANRVLAAMHRVERFPHSVSIRVDDTAREPGRIWPATVAVVDAFGDAIVNQQRIGNPNPLPGLLASTSAIHFALDPVVNMSDLVFEEVPSNLQGRAQIQLFAPTIEVTDGSGTNVTVRIQMLARYFPDRITRPMPEFVRGELRVTAPVTQVASQKVNVVKIDIKAANVNVSFVAHWANRPLSAQDMAAINLLIRNALKTSFQPSDSTLPSNIRHMQFKTLQGVGNAIAVLLTLEGDPGDRDSVSNIFLAGADDFAVGVGVDFVRAAFQPTLDEILIRPVDRTWTYTFKLHSASVSLRDGQIVITIKGRATSPSWWRPNFNFTVDLKFSLVANGATADLVPGDVSIDTSSWIIDRFRGRANSTIRKARDRAIAESGVLKTVGEMLSADLTLGGFLNSLLKPAIPTTTPQPPGFLLAYSAVEILPSGIILRGSLSADAWPPGHAAFEQIPVSGKGPLGATTGAIEEPEYSALNSWIPGGTVQRYEWKSWGQSQPGFTDENRFVYRKPEPGVSTELFAAMPVSWYAPLCVTVHGSRLSASGPVVAEPVAATVCAVKWFPILDAAFDGDVPLVALAEPGPEGMVRVVGHTSARTAEMGRAVPNLIVHFGDRSSAGNLDVLLHALRESARVDASTAVVAVFSTADMASVRYTEGITYTEDQDGIWERRFGVRIARRPTTLIVAPNGNIAWQHEGELDGGTLAAALRTSLVAGRRVTASIQPTAVRTGRPPPNFLFEYASGMEVTLRKIAGRPVILVFWRSSSKQSIEIVRELEKRNANGDAPLVLAINDGDAADMARKVAAENKLSAIIVTDASRNIARAYGVNTWPTVVSIDALGVARTIGHGNAGRDTDELPVQQTIVRSSAP